MMQLTTELEAVNAILLTIGEAPILSLTGTLIGDTELARSTLSEVSRRVQGEGWYFNVEQDYTLSKGSDGTITLPANAASVEVNQATYGAVTPRGNKLYDLTNHTDKFTQDVIATKVVFLLDWDQLPETARQYIYVRAARQFHDRVLTSESIHSYSEQDEQDAKRALLKEHYRVRNLNALNSPGVRDILRR